MGQKLASASVGVGGGGGGGGGGGRADAPNSLFLKGVGE